MLNLRCRDWQVGSFHYDSLKGGEQSLAAEVTEEEFLVLMFLGQLY